MSILEEYGACKSKHLKCLSSGENACTFIFMITLFDVTYRSKSVPISQIFFVCASLISYMALVVVLICSSSLLPLLPREGCVSWLWYFLDIFPYILVTYCYNTVELQWLEHLWGHENLFEIWVVVACYSCNWHFTHLRWIDSSTLIARTDPFLIEGVSGKFLLLSSFVEISYFNANSVDPDQMPRSAVSDLGLHWLPIFLYWDARHKWIKGGQNTLNTDCCIPTTTLLMWWCIKCVKSRIEAPLDHTRSPKPRTDFISTQTVPELSFLANYTTYMFHKQDVPTLRLI